METQDIVFIKNRLLKLKLFAYDNSKSWINHEIWIDYVT